jgi:hypothetical protein
MTATTTRAAAGTLALAAALSACGGKDAANDKNMAAAVDQYYAKKGEQCLDPMTWPTDVYETDLRQQKLYPDGVAGQMSALEAVGLARGDDIELPGTFVDGKPSGVKVKVRRYTLTDAAKPYLRQTSGKRTVLCWGHKQRDKLLGYDQPRKYGGVPQTGVIYTYKLDHVADWARKPQIAAAFPAVGANIAGENGGKEKLTVQLKPEGWQAYGLND